MITKLVSLQEWRVVGGWTRTKDDSDKRSEILFFWRVPPVVLLEQIIRFIGVPLLSLAVLRGSLLLDPDPDNFGGAKQ